MSRAAAPKSSFLVRGSKDVFGAVWKMASALGASCGPGSATLPRETPKGRQLSSLPWAAQLGFVLHSRVVSAVEIKQHWSHTDWGLNPRFAPYQLEDLVNSLTLPDPPLSHLENGPRTTHLLTQLLNYYHRY